MADICAQLGVETGWTVLAARTWPQEGVPPPPQLQPNPTTPAINDASSWGVAQFAEWLRSEMKLQGVADAAVDEGVDGMTALEMEKSDWKELGASGIQAAKIVANLKKLAP